MGAAARQGFLCRDPPAAAAADAAAVAAAVAEGGEGRRIAGPGRRRGPGGGCGRAPQEARARGLIRPIGAGRPRMRPGLGRFPGMSGLQVEAAWGGGEPRSASR